MLMAARDLWHRDLDWSTDLIPASAEAPVRQGYQLTGWLTESGQKITTSNASSITYGTV